MRKVKHKDIKMNRIASLSFRKKQLFLLGLFLVLSCGKNDLERNPYLPDLTFSLPINLSLPQYDNLRFAGGSLLLPNAGHKGIHLFNLNGSSYMAWEASCPNHLPSSCSQTQLVGVLAECACDDYRYSMATGQLLNPPEGATEIYSLIMYRVDVRGNSLVISN